MSKKISALLIVLFMLSMILTFFGAYAKLEHWESANTFLIIGNISQIVALIIIIYFIVNYFTARKNINEK